MSAAAALIRRTRTKSGLTQRELADRLGKAQATIAKLEREGANPTLATLTEAMRAAGYELELRAKPIKATLDEQQIRDQLRMTPGERANAMTRLTRALRSRFAERVESMVEWPPFKPQPIIQMLTARGVDFVVIGGYAAVLHGSPRITRDLDICYATDAANLAALGRVLTDLRAAPAGVDEDVPFVADGRTLARVELLTLTTELGRLDVMTAAERRP